MISSAMPVGTGYDGQGQESRTVPSMLVSQLVIEVGDPVRVVRMLGPLEFVEDQVNGFVCDPSPEALAAAINRLAGGGNLL